MSFHQYFYENWHRFLDIWEFKQNNKMKGSLKKILLHIISIKKIIKYSKKNIYMNFWHWEVQMPLLSQLFATFLQLISQTAVCALHVFRQPTFLLRRSFLFYAKWNLEHIFIFLFIKQKKTPIYLSKILLYSEFYEVSSLCSVETANPDLSHQIYTCLKFLLPNWQNYI